MYIRGISAFYHDSAACLVQDGEIVATAQEEWFTRKKHDPGFPRRAVQYCLGQAGIGIKDLKYVAFYDKPLVKLSGCWKLTWDSPPKEFNRSWPRCLSG